jgi:hypothetical protein
VHTEPLQPVNAYPGCGVAVSVTVPPSLKLAVQVVPAAPQVMPAGLLETEPAPVGPEGTTVTVDCGVGGGPKFATTAWFDPSVTVQDPVPEQAPLQPVNAEPDAGVAARLTTVFAAKPAEHVVPQMIPAGALATAPVPVPAALTDNV